MSSKKKRRPLVENTDSRGEIELKLPGIEVRMPATNRSAMIVAAVVAFSFGLLALSLAVLLVWAPAENITSLGDLIGKGDERRPERVPVQTDDGIEIVEVCPPCPVCECPLPAPCPVRSAIPVDGGRSPP